MLKLTSILFMNTIFKLDNLLKSTNYGDDDIVPSNFSWCTLREA